jgi:hypothetical protein
VIEIKLTLYRASPNIFVPPNLDSSDWLLDGKAASDGFYAAWDSKGEKVEYSRFGIYEISYKEEEAPVKNHLFTHGSVAGGKGLPNLTPWDRTRIEEN